MAKTVQPSQPMNFNHTLVDLVNTRLKTEVAFDTSVSSVDSEVSEYISTDSPMLDMIISNNPTDGGIPVGRMTEIFGPEASGKSSLAYHISKNTQKKGGVVAYFDIENAFSWDLAQRIGLNTNENFIYFTDLSVQKLFESIEVLVNEFTRNKDLKKIPLLVVWDSIAQSITEEEIESEYEQIQVGVLARAITKGLRKLIPSIQKSRVTLLFINQERDKIGGMGFGEQTSTPGGKILKYAASVRVRVARKAWLKDTTGEKEAYGIRVVAETKKNKIAPPARKSEYDFLYSTGVNDHEFMWEYIAKFPKSEKYVRKGNTVTVQTEKGPIDLSRKLFADTMQKDENIRNIIISEIAKTRVRTFSDMVIDPELLDEEPDSEDYSINPKSNNHTEDVENED